MTQYSGGPPPGAAPDPDSQAAPARSLNQIATAVGAARSVLREGGVVDLAGLDTRVAALCDSTLALDGDAGRSMLPALAALVEDLSALADECRQSRAATAFLLQQVGARDRAARAYGAPPPLPPGVEE